MPTVQHEASFVVLELQSCPLLHPKCPKSMLCRDPVRVRRKTILPAVVRITSIQTGTSCKAFYFIFHYFFLFIPKHGALFFRPRVHRIQSLCIDRWRNDWGGGFGLAHSLACWSKNRFHSPNTKKLLSDITGEFFIKRGQQYILRH
jgi:hypothetical protein